MKQRTTNRRTLLRTTQIAIASATFALLAACGGGGGSSNASSGPPSGVNMQVVAFGTSLTDAGTYQPILLGFGGGRFTTNPGEVWAQKVSEYFGSPLTPAFEGGFGSTLSATGGLDYAQGGAWVATNAGTADPFTTAVGTTTQMPVTWQVQEYLSQHGSFNANQLVLVEGGANDILNNVTAILGTVIPQILSNPTATQAEISGYVQTATQTALQSSATAFATVIGQILQNGAKHVAVVNVPDIGNTPLSQANGEIQTAIGALVTQALQADNVPAPTIAVTVPAIQAQVPALVSGVVQTYNGMVTYA
ncbi:MAG TPA: SGNH/GDSL hydrolase family protein, partial [Paraburkholderia sp.]